MKFLTIHFFMQQPKSLFGVSAAAADATPSLFGQSLSGVGGTSLFGNVSSGAASPAAAPFGQKVFGGAGATASPASSAPAAATITTAASGESIQLESL